MIDYLVCLQYISPVFSPGSLSAICFDLCVLLPLAPGACTMMVAEQTQGYRISFELTKPNHSNLAMLVL